MAQEFWDNKQQEWEEEWMGKSYLDLDEDTKKRLMEKVINILEKNNLDFKVEGNKVMIKGLAVHFEPAGYTGGVEQLEIIDGDKKIEWETYMGASEIKLGTIGIPGYPDSVKLPRDIKVNYNLPYLTIIF